MESQSFALPGDQYGYTGLPVDQIQTNNITLCESIFDESGSTRRFKELMEKAVKFLVRANLRCPNVDNMMYRHLAFDTAPREVHGWKPMFDCNEADYDNCWKGGGQTDLFGTAINGINAMVDYAEQQAKLHYNVNGIFTIMSDGMHFLTGNDPYTQDDLKAAMEKAIDNEALESIKGILIGVGGSDQQELKALATHCGFEHISIDDVTEESLAKIMDFISRSFQATSKQLGKGTASQPLGLSQSVQSLTF